MLIAICDDERVHREHTAALARAELAEYEADIDCFESARALLLAMSAGDYTPDIAILDIQMDGMDGISLAKRLNGLAPDCRIIFLTSFLSFATEVYSTEHVYFIVKSEIRKRLGDALRKAATTLPMSAAHPAVVCISGRAGAEVIPMRDILYMERAGRKTRVVTIGGERLTSQPPAELLGSGMEGSFIRCHNSFWVNLLKISALGKDDFVLDDGSSVPISRGYKQRARTCFFDSLVGK